MALAKVKKIELLAHATWRAELLALLQEAGVVQLEEAPKEETGLRAIEADVSRFDSVLHRLKRCLDILSAEEKRSLVDRISGRKPLVSLQEREELLTSDYLSLVDKIERIETEKSEILSRIKFLQKEMDFLEPLSRLDLPLSSFRGNGVLEVSIGTIPLDRLKDLEQLAKTEALWYEVVHKARRVGYVLLLYLRREKDLMETKLREVGLSPIYMPEALIEKAAKGKRVADVLDRDAREIEANLEKTKDLEEELKELAIHQEKLAKIYDVLYNEREKVACSRLLGSTEKVVYLEGWVRADDVPRLKKVLSPHEAECALFVRDPLPDEDSPAILKNPKPIQPFEVVTKLYGLPDRRSLDPTIPLAPFFFIFVGLCVSEAGYGLVVALLSLLYLKFGRAKGGALQFFRLLFFLGVSNIFLGTLVGGWFGFPVRQLALLDPLQDPLSFLVLSLVLGFAQVWFGTLLKLIIQVKERKYVQAIFVSGGWLVLLPALVAYFLTRNAGWGVVALAGATGIVLFSSPRRNPLARLFGGLYSLYDISKYLGDVLSYSRLLALGLATGVIAMVVNTLARTALGIPWVGWAAAAVIFVGGHLFNLAISFLGGFVHSMRLQFVEFFTKFFQAGGRPFRPFKLESKYAEFIST